MTDDRSLVPRKSGELAHPGQTPVYQQATPSWTEAPLTREECLQLVPVKVRDTVFERVGASIDWWASDLDANGITLVAFGSKALVVVSPTAGREGKPAFKLETIHLNDKTRRKARVQDVAISGRVSQAPQPPPSDLGQARLAKRLASMQPFLRMLPPRAQELMQEPFVGGSGKLDVDYLIFRHGVRDATGATMVSLWGYITDLKVLTLCSGVGHGYREGVGVASWDVNCWRVETVARKAVTA